MQEGARAGGVLWRLAFQRRKGGNALAELGDEGLEQSLGSGSRLGGARGGVNGVGMTLSQSFLMNASGSRLVPARAWGVQQCAPCASTALYFLHC